MSWNHTTVVPDSHCMALASGSGSANWCIGSHGSEMIVLRAVGATLGATLAAVARSLDSYSVEYSGLRAAQRAPHRNGDRVSFYGEVYMPRFSFGHFRRLLMLVRANLAIFVAGLLISERGLAQTPRPVAPSATPTRPLPVAVPRPPAMTPSIQAFGSWGSLGGPPMKSVPRWYGWQTMIPLALMDIATLSAWAVESCRLSSLSEWERDPYGASNSSAFRFFQIAVIPVHTLAGPIVHFAHGHVRQGFVSFGLNMSLAYLGLTPITFFAAANNYRTLFEYAPAFSVFGILAANAIDIAYLSHDTVQVPLSQSRGARGWQPSSVALVPMLNAQERGFALMGQF